MTSSIMRTKIADSFSNYFFQADIVFRARVYIYHLTHMTAVHTEAISR